MSTEGAQSIVRAGRMILAIAEAGPEGLRLSALAARLDLPHPTVHRILAALCAVGVLYRSPDSTRYFLGDALAVRRSAPVPLELLKRIVRPSLQRLAAEQGDNVFLSVREGQEAVCVDRVDGPFPIRYGLLDIGVRRPLGIGAASLALLADLSDPAIDGSISANIERMTGPHAPDRMWLLVKETRKAGYAYDDGRLFPGGCGVGMAISLAGRGAVGAISIGAIAERMPRPRAAVLAEAMRIEILRISEELADLI